MWGEWTPDARTKRRKAKCQHLSRRQGRRGGLERGRHRRAGRGEAGGAFIDVEEGGFVGIVVVVVVVVVAAYKDRDVAGGGGGEGEC